MGSISSIRCRVTRVVCGFRQVAGCIEGGDEGCLAVDRFSVSVGGWNVAGCGVQVAVYT